MPDRDPYPVCIIKDRYGGVYSGAQWTAFHAYEPPGAASGEDTSAHSFWMDHEDSDWIGKGDTPDKALANLIERMEATRA